MISTSLFLGFSHFDFELNILGIRDISCVLHEIQIWNTASTRSWCRWWTGQATTTTSTCFRGHGFCQETGLRFCGFWGLSSLLTKVTGPQWSTVFVFSACLFGVPIIFQSVFFLSKYIYNSKQQWNIYEARGSLLLSYMHLMSISPKSKKRHFY